MATSGNTSWELTRNEIIEGAYRKLGIPGEGNTLSTEQYTNGAQALNGVIALAAGQGMPIWKRVVEEETLSTTSQIYTISNAVKISGVYLRDTNGVQYALQPKSLYDFMQLPRSSIGIPVHWTWQPAIAGGTVSIWPLTSDSGTVSQKVLEIVYQKRFDGFFSALETPDFPAAFTLALTYKTALVLAPEIGLSLEDRSALKKEMQDYWDEAISLCDEGGSVYIQPNRRY